MYQFDVNFALLVAAVGFVMALVFDWFPYVAQWFDGLEESQKKLINVGGVVVIAVGIFVGDCYGLFDTNLACTLKGALDLLIAIAIGVSTNYGAHKQTKPSTAIKARMWKLPQG